MTNLEALRSELDPFVLTDNKLILKLQNAGLVPDETYTSGNYKQLARLACGLLVDCKQIVSNTEGGYSITYDSSAVDSKITSICKDSGLDVSDFIHVPTVRRASQYW